MQDVNVPARRDADIPVRQRRIPLSALLFQLRAFIALIILAVAIALLTPTFLTAGNLVILTEQVALNAILGIGMTFVILTGGIDLSVGSIVGLAAMVAGMLIDRGVILPMFGVVVYFNVWIVMLAALLVGMIVGAINGVLITRFGVPPF